MEEVHVRSCARGDRRDYLRVLELLLVGGPIVALFPLSLLVAVQARAELLEEQASTDVLTGIANRRSLDDTLDREIAGSRRS